MKDEDRERHAVRLQAWWRGELARTRTRKLAKNLIKRRYIIRELVDTEERYIRDLGLMVSDFRGGLLKRKIVSKEEASVLFSNVDQIRQLNELFFAGIFEQVQHYGHYRVIFDRVEKEIHFFKLYFEYLNNYSISH
jgi:hypothetical protein